MDRTITGTYGRVQLFPLEEKDIERLRTLRNRYANCFVYAGQISPAEQRQWYQAYRGDETDLMFRVSLPDAPEELIGVVALYHIDRRGRRAEFGRLMIDRDQIKEKGLGYEATVCACQCGFDRLGLEEIFLEVFADNISALKTYRRAGFVMDGEETARQKILRKMKLLKTNGKS